MVAILRAGLGLVDGFLRLVPEARVGHLGMYRDEEALRPVGYYENMPSGVEEAEVFVVDPMLATGGWGVQAIARMKRAGARGIHFVCLVAAPEGVPRCGKRTRTWRSRPPRSTGNLTRTATSGLAWATRAIASSEPIAEVCPESDKPVMVRGRPPSVSEDPMAFMQCPECKLTVPATATYLRGDQCPRCMTTMEPRDRFRSASSSARLRSGRLAAAVPPAWPPPHAARFAGRRRVGRLPSPPPCAEPPGPAAPARDARLRGVR